MAAFAPTSSKLSFQEAVVKAEEKKELKYNEK